MPQLTAESVLKKIQKESLLPPIPRIIIKGKELINDERRSMKEIATLIEADPSITGKVLSAANSPYYGFMRKVDTIET